MLLRDKLIGSCAQPGSLFPSQNELAREYEVSHVTVREAVGMLVQEGLLNRIQGKGTFVAEKRPVHISEGSAHVGLALYDSTSLTYPAVTFETQIIAQECNRRSMDIRTFVCPGAKIKGTQCHLERIVAAGELAGLLLRFPPCPEDIELLRERKLPFVVVGVDVPDIPCVSVDIAEGARLATEHLLALGHRKIGLLLGPEQERELADRFIAGHEMALRAHGLGEANVSIPYDPWGLESGKACARRMLGVADPPTAVICAEEFQALGFMLQAMAMGRSIPSDFSVVGYSDRLDVAAYPVPLTTVDTKLEQQNILSVELLLDIMAGKGKERNLKVVPTLVARGSTGCPNI